jgi:phosphoenolpyruvate synthase/pyruvate phosphate dikinase
MVVYHLVGTPTSLADGVHAFEQRPRCALVDVAWLGEPAAHAPALVGGKAASLSRLAAEHPVPPGFVLTSEALSNAAPELARGEVPDALRGTIDAAYAKLGGGRVAVRSSAVDEDGDAHSFAGQHETFLNVEGASAVAEAVVLCFASAFTTRALDYRLQVGLPVENISLAVLVQAQVLADSAAVVFSANPVNGRLDEVVVNASYGLGESIVGGTTTPDTFVVRKSDLAILSCEIGEKRLMTVPAPGGTREVETPALLRDLPSLPDALVTAMAELAIALETAAGTPLDLECAVKDGSVYLLQSRPITTLRLEPVSERSVS